MRQQIYAKVSTALLIYLICPNFYKFGRTTGLETGSHHDVRNCLYHLRSSPKSQHSQLPSNLSEKLNCSTNGKIICDVTNRFRTFDGTCNNLINVSIGASNTPYERMLPPAYADGIQEPRGGFVSHLPNARLVSTMLHPDLISPDQDLTNMVPQFGQFLAHDISFAFISGNATSTCLGLTLIDQRAEGRKCCRETGNKDCWNIPIPPNDKFYSKVNQTCLDFMRSAAYCTDNNVIREQVNSATAYLDCSQVYGPDSTTATYFRTYSRGQLKVNGDHAGFLPSVKSIENTLKVKLNIGGEYASGDKRVNDMPGLTVMHTLFVREHNRLANEIWRHSFWLSDEDIYQTVRRLLIAQWQKIAYEDYLPVTLGPQVMASYGLTANAAVQSEYIPNTNPTILQAFACAAYRFGHSLVNGVIQMMKESSVVTTYRLRDGFLSKKWILAENGEGYNLILNGLIQQNSQKCDRFATEDLTNFLFRKPENQFGGDLVARNIQRGRDHGIPSYSEYRAVCNMSRLVSWKQRPLEIPAFIWKKLQSLYSSPQDIDLFPAGLSEIPGPDSLTGPTFSCIIAKQFQRLKDGDRYFYTHKDQVGSFTSDQVTKIKSRTLGDIICQNSNLKRTQGDVFRPVSPANPWKSCTDPSRNFNFPDFFITK